MMEAEAWPDAAHLSTARQILGYLSRHPQAKDTREGIAAWWIQHQRVELAVHRVVLALELLARQNFVLEATGPDRRRYYTINPRRLAEIARFLSEPGPELAGPQ
jgi:hypothetical protein